MNQQLLNITELLRTHVDRVLMLVNQQNLPAAREAAADAIAECRLLRHQITLLREPKDE